MLTQPSQTHPPRTLYTEHIEALEGGRVSAFPTLLRSTAGKNRWAEIGLSAFQKCWLPIKAVNRYRLEEVDPVPLACRGQQICIVLHTTAIVPSMAPLFRACHHLNS